MPVTKHPCHRHSLSTHDDLLNQKYVCSITTDASNANIFFCFVCPGKKQFEQL